MLTCSNKSNSFLRKGHLVTTAVKVFQSTNAAKPSLYHVTKLVKYTSKPALQLELEA